MSSGQAPVNAINIPGMLKNMLREGFSTVHCLSEMIDDSQGASAKVIQIHMDSQSNHLIVADDGNGMTRDKLESSHYFHSRSSASNKHGRFGIGRKHALVHFTALKGVAQTITRSAESNVLSQLNIDFPKVIASGNLYLLAHGIEEESRPIWNKYAVTQDGKGTLTYLECDKNILAELIQRAKSDDVTNSLRYFLGSTYHNYLKSGGQIILDLDGERLSILPIDRLCWDTVKEKDEQNISIYYNPATREVRAYFTEKHLKPNNGKLGYLKKGKKKHSFEKGSPTSEFKLLGLVNLRCAYSEDWLQLQKEVLINAGVNVPEGSGEGVEELRRVLGGTDIQRNGKLIAMFEAEKAKSGDKAGYQYVENSRYSVKFSAVPDDNLPEDDDVYTLDDVFNVQVNKSRIDTSLIHMNLWATIEKIRRNYATSCYKRLHPQPEEEAPVDEVPEDNTDAQPPFAPSSPADGLSSCGFVIKKQKQVQEEEKPQVEEKSQVEEKPQEQEKSQEQETPQEDEKPQEEEKQPQEEEKQPQEEEKQPEEEQQQPQEEEKQPEEEQQQSQEEEKQPEEEQQQSQEEEKQPQEEQQKPQQQIIPPVIQPTPSAVVDVISHPREVPKTPGDLLIQFRHMRSKYTDAQLDAAVTKAGNVVESGITAKCRLLREIDENIQKLLATA